MWITSDIKNNVFFFADETTFCLFGLRRLRKVIGAKAEKSIFFTYFRFARRTGILENLSLLRSHQVTNLCARSVLSNYKITCCNLDKVWFASSPSRVFCDTCQIVIKIQRSTWNSCVFNYFNDLVTNK